MQIEKENRKAKKTIRVSNKILLLLVSLITFMSCVNSTLYEANTELPAEGWDKGTPLMFNVSVEDTINSYNILFNVRHTGLYPRANIYFFSSVYAPDGNLMRDTLQVILADKKGKWLGDGWGNVWTRSVIYKKKVRFPEKGIYKFEILHGERTDNLKEILDFGIEVVTSDNK
ncbi:MAG: gliding motility lipoprotein GldH [Bacteroidales bacterium]|nr:gliding motility lipoprotein GldH [Bacteroidales bacterium]